MDLQKIIYSKMPVVTDRKYSCSDIRYYAQSDVTCYIIRGKYGDLLIDTGLPHIWHGLSEWLKIYRIKHVFLTHAHVDHDWNARKLQELGAGIILHEKDRGLRRNFLSQRVRPTMKKYKLRNVTQCIGGALIKSPPYDADIYFSDNDTDLLRKLGYPADIVMLGGHTYGSSGIFSGNTLYCGDAFTMLWKKPDITPHAVSPVLMRKSLYKILNLSPQWLGCGHGLPIRFKKARPVIENYLKHK